MNKPRRSPATVLWSFCTLLTCHAVSAATSSPLTLASPFTDHMVLQREQPIPIWGTAPAGSTVHVELKSTSSVATSAKADSAGKWMLRLDALPAGGPYQLNIDTDADTATPPAAVLRDVLIGDVWLCGGQSNMAFTLKRTNKHDEIARANNENIRVLHVKRAASTSPLESLPPGTHWQTLTPEVATNFSAVAYYFGRNLQEHLHVPIGLVSSSVGGTSVESWTSREVIQKIPEFRKPLQDLDNTTGKLATKDPTVHYNAMIAPLVPLAVKGVIWYQGEANVSRAEQYRTLFPALIRNWRDLWGAPRLPFLFVQLPVFHERKPGPREDAWSELRDAQLHTFRTVPNTGMVVAVDTGDPKDIHPKDKEPIGVRLANAARAIAYREDMNWSGPIYTTATIEGSRMRVSFDHTGGGLTATDFSTSVTGVAIAGKDRKFVWAHAEIDPATNTLLVSSADVPEPVAVRYAWAANPEGNLMSMQGLPASPFRTDNWPGLTHGKKKWSRPPQK